jgi:hypothetical protein
MTIMAPASTAHDGLEAASTGVNIRGAFGDSALRPREDQRVPKRSQRIDALKHIRKASIRHMLHSSAYFVQVRPFLKQTRGQVGQAIYSKLRFV